MTKFVGSVSTSALTLFLVFGAMSAATLPTDLSKYRNFQLGTDLPTIAKQVGASPSQAKLIHRRPALIQELEWWPQPLGPSSAAESAQKVVFSFYDGELLQVAISYDPYETEGLTADDFIEAISAPYGIAERPPTPANTVQKRYGDPDEIVARWQDSQYCFNLIRFSNGSGFSLVGVLKRLQAPVQAAITEAKRLDVLEAPQRDAARVLKRRKQSEPSWKRPGS